LLSSHSSLHQEQTVTTYRAFATRSLVAIALAGALGALAPAWSQPNDAGGTAAPQQDPASRQARIQQHLQARLDRMAERLEIDASQQDAWAAYTKTVQGLIGSHVQRPAPDADAATVARFRAQLAAERAQKLSQLADATAALQQALRPEQQQTLNEIVRHFRGRGYHGHHRSS
jgi:hypothetical protein